MAFVVLVHENLAGEDVERTLGLIPAPFEC